MTTTNRFATLEAKANAALLRHLANAQATVAGVAVVGMFEDAYALGQAGPFGIATTQPRLTLATTAVPANPVGQACVVGSGTYTVAEHQPDGTGISVLLLEVAA
jgi:hypothetical protein